MRFLPSVLAFLTSWSLTSATTSYSVDFASLPKKAELNPKDSVYETFHKLFNYVKSSTEKELSQFEHVSPSEYAYFNFMPAIRGNAIPNKGTVKFEGNCFKENTITVVTQADGTQLVTVVTSGNPTSEGCSDFYWLGTITGFEALEVTEAGTYTLTWSLPSDAKDSEAWDLQQKGIRVFHFQTDRPTTIANLLETVLLFIPEFTKNVDPKSAERNVDFMARYPQIVMEKRNPFSNLPPPAEKVHSGDFFGVIRLDGLDPMLAWAMGSTTGHTTVAQWIDGELYICESTVTDSYWPTNGIQKTPYKTWLKQAEEAGYNVVHAPLNAKARARYNDTAAIEFFRSNEGFEYGYLTMFWGWLDTLNDNYPCIPPDYSSVCLQWEVVETLFGVVDRYIPQLSNLFWNPAWNKRIGTTELNTADIYENAYYQGIDSRAIPTIVEQDSWMYQTTRYGEPAEGRAMVCCVFVCSMWKAAGLFGDMEVNCGELTNVDDYSLDILEDQYSQIIGRWTLSLNNYKTKHPYPHMAESCASLAPEYEKDPHC